MTSTAAVSSSTISLFNSSSSSTSAQDIAQIKARIASKKAELDNTEDADKTATLKKEIAALQAKLAKMEQPSSSQSGSSKQSDSSAFGTDSNASLSGESKRVGTSNADENPEFGTRTAYV